MPFNDDFTDEGKGLSKEWLLVEGKNDTCSFRSFYPTEIPIDPTRFIDDWIKMAYASHETE